MEDEEIMAIEAEIRQAQRLHDWELVVDLKIKIAKKRGSRKRGWIKLDKAWLTSSINYRFTLSEQAVFSKLLVMADECGSIAGLISDNDFRPMPYEYLAHLACCDLETFEIVLKKCKDDDSIYENSHGILLTHFDDYQFTEYDRQKPYRDAKKRGQIDQRESDRTNMRTIKFMEKKKELKRDLTESERADIMDGIDKELDEKYGVMN